MGKGGLKVLMKRGGAIESMDGVVETEHDLHCTAHSSCSEHVTCENILLILAIDLQ
jgi:hypothetical protein